MVQSHGNTGFCYRNGGAMGAQWPLPMLGDLPADKTKREGQDLDECLGIIVSKTLFYCPAIGSNGGFKAVSSIPAGGLRPVNHS